MGQLTGRSPRRFALLVAVVVAITTVAGAAARSVRTHAHPAATGATGATGATTPALPPPPNDNRNAATPVGSLPAKVTGTTVGSTVESTEPSSDCASNGGSVWYSVSVGATPPNRIGIKVTANGDLDAVVDVYQRQRSQNVSITCARTDQNGFAGLTFSPTAGATYLIRVAQRGNSVPGTFSLSAFTLPAPASAPGKPLSPNGSKGVLDSVFNTAAAYSTRLHAGTTYKINLVKRQDGCTTLGIFPPGTSSFDGGALTGLSCAGYRLFTPRITGLWSFLVSADSGFTGRQRYALHVAPATSKEMAPGIFMRNYQRYHGFLRGNVITDVRLFRFDVTSRADTELDLITPSSSPFDLKLLNDKGRFLRCICGQTGEVAIRLQTPPGRYYAVVQAEGFGWGPFTLFRRTRLITHVRISFDGFGYEQIKPHAQTRVTARLTPAVSGPVTIELQYFDPVERWQFRGDFNVRATGGVAVLPFTPPSVGRWRATAQFNGTRTASPSASGFANLLVAGPLIQ
ncbi:MAG: hypothetical protein ACYDHH_17035 [Solirubrobacteraceae bacterium]